MKSKHMLYNTLERAIKRLLVFFLMFVLPVLTFSQTTYNPSVQSRNNSGTITKVTLTDTETIVYITFPKYNVWGGWIKICSATVLVPCDAWNIENARKSNLTFDNMNPVAGYEQLYVDAIRRVKEGRQVMSNNGWLIRNLGPDQLDTKYKATKGETHFELHFDRVPIGQEYLYLRELDTNGGFEWYGIRINNPYPSVENMGYNENSIKSVIDKQNDGIVGIYQGLTQTDNQYTLGCIKHNGIYKFIYLDCKENMPHWKVGDVKAILTPTATPTTYKMNWHMADKSKNSDCYVVFEGTSMKCYINGNAEDYIKMYPTNTTSTNIGASSGTGFMLNTSGYIITNYHVIDGARTIKVSGLNDDNTKKYTAKVEVCDKQNDLAIIKINDPSFKSLTSIPYTFKFSTSSVGEECFVLGYPLISSMGMDIKLTNGIISSKTGYDGNIAQYQISAPVQPGNSGGPLFDKNGNIIGIVQAKHTQAENAGYAIKASYIRNLVELLPTTISLPKTNQLTGKTLPQQVEKASKAVCVIIVNGD